jgi:hypothetical protein
LLGGLALAIGCRSGQPAAADQVAAFRRLLTMEVVAAPDTVCVGVAQASGARDAPPAVLAALHAELPGVRPLSGCDAGANPAWKRLYLITVKRTGDTLVFTGAVGRVTYRCHVSYSEVWPGTCVASYDT